MGVHRVNYKVAIVGAGRMASILAHRIPGSVRKVIIARRRSEALALADEVGGVASEQMSTVRGCRLVFMAIPGSAVPAVLQEIQHHLSEQTLVINMATDLVTDELAQEFPSIRLASAKMIGHPREVELGSPGVVILDQVEPAETELLIPLLEGIGPVILGDERKVMLANTAIVEEMVRAEASLRQRLQEIGLDRDLLPVAVSAAAPGVLRAVARGELGPLAPVAVHKIGSEGTAISRVST